MKLAYIRKRYGVPAYRGTRVRYTGNVKHGGDAYEGTITAATNSWIRIRFDGDPWGKRTQACHPTWEIEYLGLPKQTNMRRDSANCPTCGRFLKWLGCLWECKQHGVLP